MRLLKGNDPQRLTYSNDTLIWASDASDLPEAERARDLGWPRKKWTKKKGTTTTIFIPPPFLLQIWNKLTIFPRKFDMAICSSLDIKKIPLFFPHFFDDHRQNQDRRGISLNYSDFICSLVPNGKRHHVSDSVCKSFRAKRGRRPNGVSGIVLKKRKWMKKKGTTTDDHDFFCTRAFL